MLVERWLPEGEQQAIWDHTKKLREERSGERTAFEQSDQADRVALQPRSGSRHSRILADVRRPGIRTASTTIPGRAGSSASSDDDHESATLNPKEKSVILSQKEADEDIIKRYLTRYTSMHEAAVDSPSPVDGDQGITHTEAVTEASEFTGHVVDEPRTSIEGFPPKVAGIEVSEDAKKRPPRRSDSISSVVEPVPRRGSVSPLIIESPHGGKDSSSLCE